jgi:NADH-quinone oxidoreductase subunit N
VSTADFNALTPYLLLAGSIVALLLIISFLRRAPVSFAATIIAFAITIVSVAAGLDNEPRQVSNLLIVDGYAGFLSLLFLLAGLITAILARGYLRDRGGEQEEFYLLLLLATLGAMVMAAAQHFAAFILGLEILSISLYVLIGYSEEGHPPLEASIKYLILSGVASTTMLFGIALIYNATGSLILAPAGELSDPRADIYLMAGQTMVFAGLAFKLSLVPFHMWTPDVYQGAPAPVTGYLATVSKGAVFGFLLRYVLETGMLETSAMTAMIGLFAILSMVGGNLLALMQTNVKRVLAYSSIAHLGYLLIGLLAVAALRDTVLAAEASLIYLAGYTLMTLAAFGVVTVLSKPDEEFDAENIDDFSGLFWERPVTATVMTIALLSLTGIPLTAGFIIKFYLFAAGVAGGLWSLLWALVLGSAIAVFYYLRIILTMARSPDAASRDHPAAVPDGMVVLVFIGLSLISFGVFPSPLIEVVRNVLGATGG